MISQGQAVAMISQGQAVAMISQGQAVAMISQGQAVAMISQGQAVAMISQGQAVAMEAMSYLGLYGVGGQQDGGLGRAVDVLAEDGLLHLQVEEVLGGLLD